jgi:hypothetical protein
MRRSTYADDQHTVGPPSDSIEVEFYDEFLTIQKLVATTFNDSEINETKHKDETDDDSLFQLLDEEHQQHQQLPKPIFDESSIISSQPTLPRISVHIENRAPTNRPSTTTHTPNVDTKHLVAKVNVQRRQPQNDRKNDPSVFVSPLSSLKTTISQSKPMYRMREKNRSRALTILEELDTTSVTTSSQSIGDTTTERDVQSTTTRSTSDSNSNYDLDKSSFSLGSLSFPAGPSVSTSHIPPVEKKKIDKSKVKKQANLIVYNDEISMIDDGGCDAAPLIPNLLNALSQTDFSFNGLIKNVGQRELRKLTYAAREHSLLSVDSSIDYDDYLGINEIPSSSSSFDVSIENDEPREGIPKSISTHQKASTSVDEVLQPTTTTTRTTTTTTTKGGITVSENEHLLVKDEPRSDNNGTPIKRVHLWKLPALSFIVSPSTDSTEDIELQQQQPPPQPPLAAIADHEDEPKQFSTLTHDTVDSMKIISFEVGVNNDSNDFIQSGVRVPDNTVFGETIVDDDGSAIEATYTELKSSKENHKDLMTMSPTYPQEEEAQLDLVQLGQERAVNAYDEGIISEASTEYDSFKGDDDVTTNDIDDQFSINTNNWAYKVHNEIERIAALVSNFDDKTNEQNKSRCIDNISKNNTAVDNTTKNNGHDEADDDSKYYQASTTSEIRESRQITSFVKPTSLLDEKLLLYSTHSSSSESPSNQQYDFFADDNYNKPKVRRRLRIMLGGCWKSGSPSASISTWNDMNHHYSRTGGTTITGATVPMTNPPLINKTKSTTLQINADTMPTIDTTLHNSMNDASSCTTMTTPLLLEKNSSLKTTSSHIGKLLIDSEHSGTSNKSCLRRPKWLV